MSQLVDNLFLLLLLSLYVAIKFDADVDRVILFLQRLKVCGTSLSYIILRGFTAIHNLIMHFLGRAGIRIINNYGNK